MRAYHITDNMGGREATPLDHLASYVNVMLTYIINERFDRAIRHFVLDDLELERAQEKQHNIQRGI